MLVFRHRFGETRQQHTTHVLFQIGLPSTLFTPTQSQSTFRFDHFLYGQGNSKKIWQLTISFLSSFPETPAEYNQIQQQQQQHPDVPTEEVIEIDDEDSAVLPQSSYNLSDVCEYLLSRRRPVNNVGPIQMNHEQSELPDDCDNDKWVSPQILARSRPSLQSLDCLSVCLSFCLWPN